MIKVFLQRDNTGSTITLELDPDEFQNDDDIERYVAMRMLGWRILNIQYLIL